MVLKILSIFGTRPEGVEAGTLKLGGTKTGDIREATRLLDDPIAHAEMAKAANPYGDGRAAERIIQALPCSS